MNYRLVKLHAEETFAADGTKVIDINISEPISFIVFRLNVYNGSATMAGHAVACLTDLQIIDGSDVLYSLDGYEGQALDWYDLGGRFRANWNCAMNGNGWVTHIGMNFGRYPWDTMFALDPKKFTNPQLKFSLDIDAGGGSPSANYVAIYAGVFDQKIISPQGFLMSKEIKQWTQASGSHEYTDLPTDFPYRALYLRSFLYGTEPESCTTNFKLSENRDSKIPFDLDPLEFNGLVQTKYPPCEEDYMFEVSTSTKYLYVAPSQAVTAYANMWTAAAADRTIALASSDGGRLPAIVNTGAVNAQVHVRGRNPHAVIEIPFGDKNDPGDAYDVTGIRNLQADITGGAAAAAYLFLQQYRYY